MTQSYRLENQTPRSHSCIVGGCPAIYSVQPIQDLTPEGLRCGIGACPAVFSHKELGESYIVVGKRLDLADVSRLGLEGRVAEDETAVFVPRGIIDLFERSE